MGLFTNVKEILGKRVTSSTPIGNQQVGLSSLSYNGETPEDREAIYPQWFFSSRLGQPRQVDTEMMRTLSQSPWVQMVIGTFKRQIYNTEWVVMKADEDDETDRKKDIKKVTDFFMNINKNEQTIDDVNSEQITDIAEIDAGCANMVYSNDSYVLGDIPIYDNWGRVLETEIGLALKPLGQREVVAIKSVDGSSMLKQVDIHKNTLSYWQYSFKHPRQYPTRFQ
jgi:hypothetical protein